MMKKIYVLTILAFATGITAQAQRVSTGNVLPASYEFNRDFNRDVTDTISASLIQGCESDPALWGAEGGGYLSGGNSYGDLEKAQYITTETSGSIYSALAYIGGKEGGSNETYSAKLYSGDLTTGPTGAAFATSNPVSYADLDTIGLYTTFPFAEPQAYDGSLFLSFEVSQGDAIYGIVSTTGDCGNGSAYELWDTNDWVALNSLDAWGLDLVLYVYLEVDLGTTVGLEDTNLIERGSQKVFPNPSNETANLVFSLVEASDITVRVYNTTGVLVDTYEAGKQNVGLNSLTINTQDLSQGHYIYTIQTDAGVRNGKFVVVK